MPRKTKLLFVILTILFLSLPLWAENYRIGVIGSDSDYKGIIKDSLGIIAQVSSDDAVSAFISRNQATVHLEYLKSREKNLKSENFSSLTKEETSYSFSGALNIEVVDVKVEEGMMTFLSSGVLEAYDYLKKDKKLDSLLFLEEEKSGTTSSFRLLMDGAVLREGWYVNELHDYEEAALLDIFACLFLDEEHHLYRISVEPTSSSLTIDGAPAFSGYAVLRDGTHTFTLGAYGYQGITEPKVLKGEEKVLSFVLEPSLPQSLYVSVKPWDARILLNGKETDGKYAEGVYTPYTLTLTRDDFALASFQTTSDRSAISLSMKPEWLENTNNMMDRKNEFYRSLFYTIASFGGYCGFQSLSYITPESKAFYPLSVVFGGASLVSLVHLVQSAVDYYSSAGAGL